MVFLLDTSIAFLRLCLSIMHLTHLSHMFHVLVLINIVHLQMSLVVDQQCCSEMALKFGRARCLVTILVLSDVVFRNLEVSERFIINTIYLVFRNSFWNLDFEENWLFVQEKLHHEDLA